MQIVSKLVQIFNVENPSSEYIENELTNRNINPLRWAVVNVSDKMLTISVACIENKEIINGNINN